MPGVTRRRLRQGYTASANRPIEGSADAVQGGGGGRTAGAFCVGKRVCVVNAEQRVRTQQRQHATAVPKAAVAVAVADNEAEEYDPAQTRCGIVVGVRRELVASADDAIAVS